VTFLNLTEVVESSVLPIVTPLEPASIVPPHANSYTWTTSEATLPAPLP
jgi:hypothetical protein